LYKLCRTLQPNVIVNNRVGKLREGMNGFTKPGGFAGDYATPEQQIPDTVPAGADWETCMTMNDTWGFKKNDFNFKSSRELIRDLIDVASKGGNFLLNVGPTAAGEIPQQSVDRLRKMGNWMRANGDAIYGTSESPFTPFGWGRATTKPGKLYLHVFDWPANGKLVVPMRNKPTAAYALAKPGKALEFSSGADGVMLSVDEGDADADATVIVLEMPPDPIDVIHPATAPATTTSTTTRATTVATTSMSSTRPMTQPTTGVSTTSAATTKPATTRSASTQPASTR
jgi:alpha-L-fucosidase